MIIPAAALVVAGPAVVLLPRIGQAAHATAVRSQDQSAYNATVCQAQAPPTEA
jgi:hypothetical protein